MVPRDPESRACGAVGAVVGGRRLSGQAPAGAATRGEYRRP
jgi:hypothetical protein